MTILEALVSNNTFPIPVLQIEKVCIDRDLISNATYTQIIGTLQNYELATADLYVWLANSPDIKEQEVSISNIEKVKSNLMSLANAIYRKYGDPKFSGIVYGFVGERYNG